MKTSLMCECVPRELNGEYIIAHRGHRDWPVNKINHGQIEYYSPEAEAHIWGEVCNLW